MPQTLPCEQSGPKDAIITLSEDALGSQIARNGTTITVDLGKIKNPDSLKPTSSFAFKTYVKDGDAEYVVNQNNDGVTVQSKV